MKTAGRSGPLLFLAGLVVGVGVGAGGRWPPEPAASAQVPALATNPQESSLVANLYVQTAAEHHACCLQTFRLAAERLEAWLKEHKETDKKPAVVLDLDETVLDNSPFQTFLDRYRLPYEERYWDIWEKEYPQEVRAIPGARAFIAAAEKQGVTPFYLSNRSEKNRASTVKALAHLGISTDRIADRLLLSTDTSDKTARRKKVAEGHAVLMLIGDNLRDLSEEFVVPKREPDDEAGQRKAIRDRRDRVDANRGRWGVDWFILPNPVYGEWQQPLGSDPRGKMNPTTMRPPRSGGG